MKKIFTISVLSVLAVVGTASAAPDLYDGAGTSANLNVATVYYVDNAVARAKPDTSGLVAKTQVVTSDGVDMNGDELSDDLTADQVVPTAGAVQANFVPNVATTYKDDYYQMATQEMEPGLYTIMVEVDESGNKTFIWQAVQQARYRTSVGGEADQ